MLHPKAFAEGARLWREAALPGALSPALIHGF